MNALGLYESMTAEAPDNAVTAIGRGMIEVLLGRALLRSGDRAAALQHCERATQRLEPLRSANPEVYDLDYTLADGYACLGDGQEGAAAVSSYEKSLAAWRRAPTPGPYNHAGFPLGTAATVEARLAALGTR